jgi:ribosomal protein S18 acetylase RimI-like enzyme
MGIVISLTMVPISSGHKATAATITAKAGGRRQRAILMLKRADLADADETVQFESAVRNDKLYGKPLDHAAARSEIKTNVYYLNLALGRIAATGAFRLRDDASAYLSNIAVRPELRRQGLARAMMMHLLSCCSAAQSIDLAVHPDNRSALTLYASLGFAPTGCQENHFGDGEPRLIMVRPTSQSSIS